LDDVAGTHTHGRDPLNLVEQKNQQLRDYYRMGQIKLQCPDKLSVSDRELMDRYKTLNADTQRKIVNFAYPNDGYSKDDLNKLIDLCRTQEFAMGFSLVERLLSIPKADRLAAQKRIVEENWSRRDLDRWIKGTYGSRTTAGRRPKEFSSMEAIEGGIATDCLSWLRQKDNIERTRPDAIDQLPKRIRRLYQEASKAIAALNDELHDSGLIKQVKIRV
jgi:hypothetical protein